MALTKEMTRTEIAHANYSFRGSAGHSSIRTKSFPGEIQSVTLTSQKYTGKANKTCNWKIIGSILEVRCTFWGYHGTSGTAYLTFNVYYNGGEESFNVNPVINEHERLFSIQVNGKCGDTFEEVVNDLEGEIVDIKLLGQQTNKAYSVEVQLLEENSFRLSGEFCNELGDSEVSDTINLLAVIKNNDENTLLRKEEEMTNNEFEVEELEQNVNSDLLIEEADTEVELAETDGAMFELEEESMERGVDKSLDISCKAILPRIPSPLKVGKTYNIRTEHTVKVSNQTGNTIQDIIRMEFEIPGVIRKTRNMKVYAKSKKKPTFFRYTCGTYKFSFKQPGEYYLYGSTRFYGSEDEKKSDKITVIN